MSKIVDILEAERQKHKNHRYGRDYYTKQASLPAGSLKPDEIENAFWAVEETRTYKAMPATTTDSESEPESQSDENYNQWNLYHQNQPVVSTAIDLNTNNDVQKLELYYPPTETESELKITVNKKEASFSDSDSLMEQNVSSNETQHKDASYRDNNSPFPKDSKANAKKIIAYGPTRTDESKIKITVNETNASIANSLNPIQQNIRPTKIITENKDTSYFDDNQFLKEFDKSSQLLSGSSLSHNITNTAIKKNTMVGTFDESLSRQETKKTELYNPAIVVKKSDNTLIRKIYSNPIVRNFALMNREQIPYSSDIRTTQAAKKKNLKNEAENKKLGVFVEEEDLGFGKHPSASDTCGPPKNNSEINEENLLKHTFSLEFSDNDSPKKQTTASSDDDYNELKERRLVSSLIDEYSKSFPNLTKTGTLNQKKDDVFDDCLEQGNQQLENAIPFETFVSVKDLKKLFENNNDTRFKDKPLHSLTARSISKDMKEKLKTYSNTREDTKSDKTRIREVEN